MKSLLRASVLSLCLASSAPSFAAGPEIMIDGKPSGAAATSESFDFFAWLFGWNDVGGHPDPDG